jgi:hypothetical protein
MSEVHCFVEGFKFHKKIEEIKQLADRLQEKEAEEMLSPAEKETMRKWRSEASNKILELKKPSLCVSPELENTISWATERLAETFRKSNWRGFNRYLNELETTLETWW